VKVAVDMELPVVVGVDGSGPALTAVDWAVDEAARRGVPLRLVHASLWERYEGAVAPAGTELPAERLMARQVTDTATQWARRRDAEVTVWTSVLPEDPVSALVHASAGACVLVTGSRGRGGPRELLLGSVSRTLAAQARCPVIVVRGDTAGLAGSHERILLGAGDPATCGEAVRFALCEAELRDCVLDVVRAGRRTAASPGTDETQPRAGARRDAAVLDELLHQARAEHPSVRVRATTAEGPAHRVLVDRSAAADLVIVGARRATGHPGPQLGRTTRALLHHAQCPVAVVPHRVV
jgi:nucleotide-binding universal stress UspA family protein